MVIIQRLVLFWQSKREVSTFLELKSKKMFAEHWTYLRSLNRDQIIFLVQENLFYILCVTIVLYLIYYSEPCVAARNKFSYKVSQNPIRVASLAAKEKEIRLRQALKFQQEQDSKREERKKRTSNNNSTKELSRSEFEAKRAKTKRQSNTSSYNPLTGSHGSSSSYRPTNRRKKSGGG